MNAPLIYIFCYLHDALVKHVRQRVQLGKDPWSAYSLAGHARHDVFM